MQQQWAGEVVTDHLAPSEPGKGVALVKKSSEVPVNCKLGCGAVPGGRTARSSPGTARKGRSLAPETCPYASPAAFTGKRASCAVQHHL